MFGTMTTVLPSGWPGRLYLKSSWKEMEGPSLYGAPLGMLQGMKLGGRVDAGSEQALTLLFAVELVALPV